MHKRALPFAIVCCFFFLMSGSCAIKSEIFVDAEGAGEVSFRIQFSDFLLNSLEDIAEMSGGESVGTGNGSLDEERVKAGFEGKELIELTRFDYSEPTVMTGTFTFGEMEAIFQERVEISEAGILEFSDTEGKKTVKVYIDRDNFADLTEFVPLLQNPFVEMFGPSENEDVSGDEYLDMMGFALGDEGPPLIEESTVELLIDVEGEILSHRGGELRDGKLAISIPLLQLLLLPEPLEYSVTYQ